MARRRRRGEERRGEEEEEEEEDEEDERLYLQLETRQRVQTNEANSRVGYRLWM